MVSENLLKEEVRKTVKETLSERSDLCTCQQCQDDIVALALNSLRPRYAGSKEGKVVVSSTDISSDQTRLDILRVVMKAIDKVKKRPHHNR